MYKLQETVKGKLSTNRFKDMNSVLKQYLDTVPYCNAIKESREVMNADA